MKPILIIRTGHAPHAIRSRHGDFPHWFRVAGALPVRRLQLIDVTRGEELPAPAQVAGAFITGSAAMVTERAGWSERTAGWIRQAMDHELPMFGVCYGHQLMAHALGGRVDYLEGGREIGTVAMQLREGAPADPLVGQLPDHFRAHTTHEQSVIEPPGAATSLVRSARDPHHLLRYGAHALSVQFHPEFNVQVMQAYIHRKREPMRQEGFDLPQTLREVAPTPVARQLLRRFARQHALI